ncbi:MAG: hypothetical protein OEZ22_07170 [Spirochaetia bacterium]|nr:hypothetical protein [Spirochaetia bacterium]
MKKENEKTFEEQWERISNFLEAFAAEDEKIERELNGRELQGKQAIHTENMHLVKHNNEENKSENFLHQTNKPELLSRFSKDFSELKSSLSNMSYKYTDVKNDLDSLLEELQDFKLNRSSLEKNLFNNAQ